MLFANLFDRDEFLAFTIERPIDFTHPSGAYQLQIGIAILGLQPVCMGYREILVLSLFGLNALKLWQEDFGRNLWVP